MARTKLPWGWKQTLYAYFALEVAWIVFWYTSIMIVHLKYDTLLGFGFRSDLTNAFVHLSTLMMFIYATDDAHSSPEWMVLIILLGIVLYDSQMIVTTYQHANRVALPTAWQLQQAVILSGFVIGFLGFTWYLLYCIYFREGKKVNTSVQQPLLTRKNW